MTSKDPQLPKPSHQFTNAFTHKLLQIYRLICLPLISKVTTPKRELKLWVAKRLLTAGVRLRSRGGKSDLQRAVQLFEQAFSIYSSLKDSSGETTALVNLGFIHKSIGDMKQGINYYNQALATSRSSGDRHSEGTVLHNLGALYDELSDRNKALDFYKQALPVRRTVHDQNGEAYTLSCIGAIYRDLGYKEEALQYLIQALELARRVKDRIIESATLGRLANLYSSLGDNQRAIDFHQQAISTSRSIGDRRGEAASLTSLGQIYNFIGDKQKALDCYFTTLDLSRWTGDRQIESNTLNSIGLTYHSLGEIRRASEYWAQALEIVRALENLKGEATILNNIGVSHTSIGEWQEAFNNLIQALNLNRRIGDAEGEVSTQINLGQIYVTLEQWQKAANCFSTAVKASRTIGNVRGETSALYSLGFIYYEQGNKQQALQYLHKVLSMSRRAQNKETEAMTLNLLGRLRTQMHDEKSALDLFSESLLISRSIGNKRAQASALNNIAVTHGNLANHTEALKVYREALSLCHELNDAEHEAMILSNMAAVEDRRNNLPAALSCIERALNIFDSLRTKVLSKDLRASYFGGRHHCYKFYIDLLMRLHFECPQKGYDSEALQTCERSRARSLVELLGEVNADRVHEIQPSLIERQARLKEQLNARASQQTKLLTQKHRQEDADRMLIEIQELISELQSIEAEMRESQAVTTTRAIQVDAISIKEFQDQILDDDSLLLMYSLGEPRSYLWVVAKHSISSAKLLGRSQIEPVARDLYTAINARNKFPFRENQKLREKRINNADDEVARLAACLSEQLLGPVAKLLKGKRLLIVADGALQFIPFAILSTTDSSNQLGHDNLDRTLNNSSLPRAVCVKLKPLICDHEIVHLPSLSTLAQLRRFSRRHRHHEKRIAIFADPVFAIDDPRFQLPRKKLRRNRRTKKLSSTPGWRVSLNQSLSESVSSRDGLMIPRLPGTRLEAEQILRMLSDEQCKAAFDFSANRDAAMDSEMDRYEIIHFATHGLLNNIHPELSGLVLSLFDNQRNPQDGFLRLHDILNLHLAADLVTLSACQTGLGKEIRGEGLVGLTGAFMQAGSARVMVSVWSVSDPGTCELMTRFYRGLFVDSKRPSEALREAQLSMLDDDKFNAPYYWAPFILQGEYI
jgi:CHAT domain-containing protein/Tfp pilus assembly protein PilF